MLSKQNIDKLVFGGVYTIQYDDVKQYCSRYAEPLNDQKYGWWIPTHSNNNSVDKYYMIDTYEISRQLFNHTFSYDKQEYMEGLVEGLKSTKDANDKGNYASRMPFDYYYVNMIEITDDNIDKFNLVCNLCEYRLSDTNECRFYNEQDIVKGLKLYNEHNYPNGIVVVKKDAKFDYNNFINAKVDDMLKNIKAPSFCNEYYIDEILTIEKQAIENGAEYNEKRLHDILKYNEFMNKLTDLYNQYVIDMDLHRKYYI